MKKLMMIASVALAAVFAGCCTCDGEKQGCACKAKCECVAGKTCSCGDKCNSRQVRLQEARLQVRQVKGADA